MRHVTLFAAAAIFCLCTSALAETGRQPNIVLIMSDDQGWGDLSMSGNSNLSTPRIDSLAAAGAVFDHFYVQPVCSPTRAELLTGRYYPRTGVSGVNVRREYMDLDETTIGDVFKRAGYATGCFGKWHNGATYPYHPNGRGFDEFYGFCSGHWSNYYDTTLEHNGEATVAEGFIIDVFTDKAIEFITDNRDRPFLCYVPYNTPHSPFQVPDRFYDKFADADVGMRHRDPDAEDLDVTRTVLAMCENIDWNVGRILDTLASLGLEKDTIVVYLSDNGPNSWRWNAGMRGKKGSVDEGGTRSPCMIRWPGHIEGGKTITNIAGAIDLLPTLTALAGVALDTAKPVDGRSLEPLLFGEDVSWPPRALFARSTDGSRLSMRTQRYRVYPDNELFDLQEDPGQRHNLAQRQPELYRKLAAQLQAWRDTVESELTGELPALTVGYKEFPSTLLATQDADLEGGIRRSAKSANATFLTDWRSLGDRVVWELDVKTSGTYEMTLMYTCPESDLGAVVELACDGNAVRRKITEAFDPPLRDQQDRILRTQSYEKLFRPLFVGTIRLDAGLRQLTMRAVEKPGDTVCDVRLLEARLVESE